MAYKGRRVTPKKGADAARREPNREPFDSEVREDLLRLERLLQPTEPEKADLPFGEENDPAEDFGEDMPPAAEEDLNPEAAEGQPEAPAAEKQQPETAGETPAEGLKTPEGSPCTTEEPPRTDAATGEPERAEKGPEATPAAGESAPAPVKKHRKKRPKNTPWVLPGTLVFLELLLRVTVGDALFWAGLPAALLTALCFGCVLTLLCSLSNNKKLNRWLNFAFVELAVIWFIVAYFCDNAYQVYMSITMMVKGAGNVATDFSAPLVTIMTKGLPTILLYHLPAILFLVFRGKLHFYYPRKTKRRMAVSFAVYALFCGLLGYVGSVVPAGYRARYTTDYSYDSSVRSFGLLNTLQLDLRYMAFGNPYESEFTGLEELEQVEIPTYVPEVITTVQTVVDEETGEEEEIVVEEVYNPYNVMDVDYDTLLANFYDYTVESMHKYVTAQTPSAKNDFTGLFAGKNLILITAEAFSREIIDPELTPTLYRLATRGIVFEDFYQPSWGGSTSTGEYSFLTGLVPYYSDSMERSFTNNLYFTMGNQLQRLDYHSFAYHNGNYYFYSRNDTHYNLGYSEYVAIGRGMDEGLTNVWPASDLEMMEFTVPQYIDQQPFSVYYMTISGHCSYHFTTNAMSKKNRELVEDLPYSEAVQAYIAANLELEHALTYLVEQLEEAGIADDTVIAICPDHFPYGLEKSTTWNNDRDYLKEWYGYDKKNDLVEGHNAAIIWCGILEDSDPIVISEPTFSLDLLPTLSNLFGLEYDSRMLVGRDVFSEQDALVFWPDKSWKTTVGYWDIHTQKFTVSEGSDPDADYKEYIERMNKLVSNKITYSKNVLNYDYFYILFGSDKVK